MPALPADLRRVPPAGFVAARDNLARRLRRSGDREAAAEVRRLRRPSAPLWALNGLAAEEPARVSELVRAGQALRATTQAALQGQRAELGRLGGEHARLVEELTGRAMELLAALPAPATRDTRARVWTMLRVSSLDPALAPRLASGSLAEEPVSIGFDGLLGFPLGQGVESTAPPPVPASAVAPGAQTAADSRRRLDRGEDVRTAMAQVEFARAEAAERRDRLARVADRVADLRAQVAGAERELAEVESELAVADRAVAIAEAAVERLRDNAI